MVRAKPSPSSTLSKVCDNTQIVDEADEIARMESSATEPFLSFVMDEMAENPDADKSISFSMKPLEIVLNHQAAHKIVDFVYGGRAKEALETLASAAETHITELANKTRASLEDALEEHKALDLSVDIDAPVIYIPFDCEDPGAFLFIADLGHIEVRSRLVTAAEKKEFSVKRRRRLTVDELSSLYSLMYDILQVKLNKIKLSYADSLAEWSQLNADPEFLPETNRIIDDIDVSMSISSCIVPKAINLVQKKIYAKLPAVQLIFSDEKYKKMMKLFEALIPEKPQIAADTKKPKIDDFSEARNKSIFGTESTTRHSLSMSPEMGNSSIVTSETEDEFFDAVESENSTIKTHVNDSDEIPEYEAVNIDLSIEIEEICAKLIRENKKYRKKDFLTLVAKKLQIACNVKPFNTVVNLLLEAFFIRDDMNIRENEDTTFLLRGLGRAATDSLLKINVNLVDSGHPLFSDLYNSANIQVLLELAALNFFLNPATLIQTAEFFDTMFENENDYEIVVDKDPQPEIKRSKSLGISGVNAQGNLSRTLSEPKMSSRVNSNSIDKMTTKPLDKPESTGKRILLTAKLSELALIMGIGSDHFADVVLSSAHAAVCIETDGDINLSGRIADFAILHRKASRDFEFLRIDGENALDVSYKRVKMDQLVKLGTGALHFTYDAPFLEDSCDYVAKLADESKILEVKKLEKEKKLRKARRAKLRLGEQFDHNDLGKDLDVIAEEAESVDNNIPLEIFDDVPQSKLEFEIDISSPILDFPHPEGIDQMLLSVFLGHIHSSNSFKQASDSKGNPLKSLGSQLIDQFINAKLEAMRIELRSGHESQMCKLLDDVGLGVDVSLIAKAIDRNYAETDVEGNVDVVRLKIARKQLKQVLNLVESLQESLKKALQPLDRIKQTPEKAEIPVSNTHPKNSEFIVDEHNPLPTAVEVFFNVKSIELILFEEWEIEPLARFALEDLNTNLVLQRDNSMILEQYVSSICAKDLRTKVQRKFKDIIIPGTGEKDDDIKFKFEKTSDGDSIVKVEVNAPKIVLSMDFVNSIISVFEGLETAKKQKENNPVKIIDTTKEIMLSVPNSDDLRRNSVFSIASDSDGTSESQISEVIKTPIEPAKSFILAEIGKLELYILEEPDSESSEAMQLSVQKITFAQQTNMSLSIDGISAGFVNMDNLKSVVQFIDPFDITSTVEISSNESVKSTQVWAIVKPVILRFSYQDIQFFTKLSEQFSKKNQVAESEKLPLSTESEPSDVLSVSSKSSIKHYETSPALSSLTSISASSKAPEIVIKLIEQIQINLEGIRVVFIDDFTNVHIPFIDISIDRISAEIRDWTKELRVNGILKLHANFFNRSNSQWEPVIEPWTLDLSLVTKKNEVLKKMSEIVVSSEKALEIIASHSFLDSLLSVTGKMAVAKPRAASSYREVAKPYLIKNYTGYGISLWSDSKDSGEGEAEAEIVEIAVGQEFPYEFEDWKTFRSATKSKTHRISVHVMDSPWESVKNICVDQQGIFVFPLRPKIMSVLHKLVCEVEVIEGVRHIILRSATCFKNSTSFDLEVADISAEHFNDSIVIKSGNIGALPINFSSGGAFRIRPANQNYKWSHDKYDLYELLNGCKPNKPKQLSIKCDPEDPETSTPFFLDLHVQSDKPEEIIYASASLASKAAAKKDGTKFYGLGTITLCPSIEIENLLPFDFSYRIYDHDGKYDFSGNLAAGKMNPLHGVDIKHVIGFSLEIGEQCLTTKQVAVINSGKGSLNGCDKAVHLTDSAGIEASVFIDYEYDPDLKHAYLSYSFIFIVLLKSFPPRGLKYIHHMLL